MERPAAVIADLHGNREALAAVLAVIDAENIGPVYCLGDIVGYGPDPCWCVQTARARGFVSVLGNHDAVAANLRLADDFNAPALQAMRWTQAQLGPDERAYLTALPTRREVHTPAGNVCLVHGNLIDDFVTYIASPEIAADSLACLKACSCAFYGHTHRPLTWTLEEGKAVSRSVPPGEWYDIPPGPVLINPGSVGQPRDHDARAALLIWDQAGRRCQWRRVTYDIRATQEKMHAAGLPEFLITRLDSGQ